MPAEYDWTRALPVDTLSFPEITMDSGGTATMARPKKGDPKPKAKRPPDKRIAIILLKGTAAYSEWLDGLHAETHVPKATLVRLGLAEIARRYKYKTPPEV